MPEDAKPGSGLHATAKVFVPVLAKADSKGNQLVKQAGGTVGASTTAWPASASSSSAADTGASSTNGSVAASGSSSGSAAQQGGKGGAAGNRSGKPAGNTNNKQSAGAGISKLAAAASAPPFVPGKTGTTTSVSSTGPTKEPKQQGRQSGRGGRNQQQGRQQTQKEQKDQQHQKEQQQQKEQQKEQQKDGQKEQEQQQKETAREASKTPTGKMSAAAAAFVPKNVQIALSASAPASSPSPAANSSSNSLQQPARPQSASSSATSARLKSPLKSVPVSTSANTPAAPLAAQASPARSAGLAGRGRAPRNDGPSSSRPSNLGLGPGSNAGPLPPGSIAGSYGTAAAGGGYSTGGWGMGSMQGGMGGAKRMLLAQFQGNYGQFGATGFGGYQHQQQHGAPGKQLLSGQFMMEGLKQQLQQNKYLVQMQYSPTGDEPPLPDKIGHYHTLYPLEDLAASDAAGVSSTWGVRTTILKGISARDGHAYALRVVCGKQVIPSHEMLAVVRSAVDAWSSLNGHPGLLVPVDGFVSAELDGSQSLVVVHSYVPGAVTLTQAHLQPAQTASGQLVRNTPNEELIWSYTVQLAALLRAAHATGLAVRPAALSANKVLVTPVGRLKVSGLGVAEALTGEVVPQNSEDLTQLQRDDIVAMGQLLLQLACAVNHPAAPSLDFASLHYSQEFMRLLMLLLSVADGAAFSWRAVSAVLGERLLMETDSVAVFNEQLLEDLSKEMENGRLFRLVSKLGFVTDRQADAQAQVQSAAWSETGDRYLLQLFKDFVFHQGELDNGRVIDWGHIIESLNKLDAGVSEQILLQSRDERSLLVVSYADVKRCVEASIADLRTRGNSTGSGGVGPIMRPLAGAAGLGGAYMYTGMGR